MQLGQEKSESAPFRRLMCARIDPCDLGLAVVAAYRVPDVIDRIQDGQMIGCLR